MNLYSLPHSSGEKDKTRYWVAFLPKEGFEAFLVSSMDSVNLSKKYIADRFINSLSGKKLEYNFEIKALFAEVRIVFIIEESAKGKKAISLSTYFLETEKHLDEEGATLCSGSSQLTDGVPGVLLLAGKVHVDIYRNTLVNSKWGIRRAVA